MLALTRKPGERIVFTDAKGIVLVTLHVVRATEGAVRLGIDAPGIGVYRSELWQDAQLHGLRTLAVPGV